MKKLLPVIFFLAFCAKAGAQTATISLITAPCDSDGVMVVHFSGFTYPIYVDWSGVTGGFSDTVTSGSTDTFSRYAGAEMYAFVWDSTHTHYATAYDSGRVAFSYSLTVTNQICSTPGSISATCTGGTAPYSCTWYNMAGSVAGVGNPVSLPAGFYTTRITDSHGCVVGTYWGDSIGVRYTSGMTVSVATTPANCTNGTATISSYGGGVSPYSFRWFNGSTASSVSGLRGGTYSLAVTDSTGCTDSSYFTITSPLISDSLVPTYPSCRDSNGAIIAFGGRGIPPYTYLWSNGVTTQSQTGLPSGYYSVIATDSRGCVSSPMGISLAPTSPIYVSYTTVPTSCTAPTGKAVLTYGGGTTPYTVTWGTIPVQTGDSATNLPQGYYSFSITDAVGCTRTGTVYVPPVHNIYLTSSTVMDSCYRNTGEISVAAYGGSTPYTYSWSSGASTTTITGLSEGWQHVLVTDSIGCTTMQSFSVNEYSPMRVGLYSTPTCLFGNSGQITASAWGGTTPYHYSWSNGATTAIDTGLSVGRYNVFVVDSVGCRSLAWGNVTADLSDSSCFCVIRGNVFHDTNSNCTLDSGELGVNHAQIHCSGIGYTYTDTNGYYYFLVPRGTYTIHQDIETFYPLAACQVNDISVTTSAGAGCYQVVNFADSIVPIHQMEIQTWDYDQPRPGFSYRQISLLLNNGTVAEPGVVAGYNSDTMAGSPTFLPSSLWSGSGTWHSTTSAMPTIPAGYQIAFYTDYSIAPSVPLDVDLIFKDTVAYASPMSNWLSDYTPWNNVRYHTSTTVGSYDPNFKEVSPKGTGSEGHITRNDSILTFMVHFQNVGTYYAENVAVRDTLDRNLDWSTLRPLYTSAACNVTMNDSGAISFNFNHINLPGTSDPVNSNGMLSYSVKTRRGLPLGTQIRNKASIYFDFNAPIVTNTTLNTLFDSGLTITSSAHDTICSGTYITFAATTGDTVGAHYHWQQNGTAVGTDSVHFTTNTIATGDVFHCSISRGASSVYTDSSNEITMVVALTPPTPVISGTDSICLGTSTPLTASVSGGTWASSASAVASVSTSGIIHTIAPGVTNIAYTISGRCAPAVAYFHLAVLPPLVASVSFTLLPGDTVCAGDSISLTAHPVNGGTLPLFHWKRFGITFDSGMASHYLPTNGDVLTCEMTSNAQCIAAATVVSTSETMLVNAVATPSITIISGLAHDSATNLGQVVNLYATASLCGSAPTYQWYMNRVAVTGATSTTFATAVYGNDTFYCITHCNAPCLTQNADTSSKLVIYADYLVDAVHPLILNGGQLALAPNPNNGNFSLTGFLSSQHNETLSYEVINVLGKVVHTGSMVPDNGVVNLQIDLNGALAPGNYLFRLHTVGGTEFIHFVVQ